MANSATAAVIDIGSNSIKLLVAQRTPDGLLKAERIATIDARISTGITQTPPRLSEEGMLRGLEAVTTLLGDAAKFDCREVALVATSAVRDALNGDEFRQRVQTATGHTIRILSGDEEANLIGRGLTRDPVLHTLRDFYSFDLGGGSLECLAFRNREIVKACSLQLGCVRLMEKFITDPTQPFTADEASAVSRHVQDEIRRGFDFALPKSAIAIATGGTATTARAIYGARVGLTVEQTDSCITVSQLRELLAEVGALPLAERRLVPGLPPRRADVFPTALATLITLAELGGFDAYQNSFYNLRWGVAAEILERSR